MKVLWIVSTAANYNSKKDHMYNGCGWISSLESKLKNNRDIELAETFFVRTDEPRKVIIDDVAYFPIKMPFSSKLGSLASLFKSQDSIDNKKVFLLLDRINEIHPDIIHVFGTEDVFGLVAQKTSVPVVVHLQGILNPIFNAFLPPFMSWREYPEIGLSNKHRLLRRFDKRIWKYKCDREKRIFLVNKHYMGRTEWDKMLTRTYNNNSNYYVVWEILRDCFYQKEMSRSLPQKLTLVSTISNTTYKGFDIILKTAKVLKDFYNIDFIWKVFGGVNKKFYARFTDIQADNVNVEMGGIASAEVLKEELQNATCYVHPSYIDNSPNSVCEAMILGCPVVSTDVGGISTLINNGVTGFLVPANDPYMMADRIITLYRDRLLNIKIGTEARNVALIRHDPELICKKIVEVYKEISNNRIWKNSIRND